jgi:hypothetical protein
LEILKLKRVNVERVEFEGEELGGGVDAYLPDT